ncbi:MAG: bifunctional phosphopantothenoylcysteine decarboxylase/phosphopantothenate--cysteine ligase CoaBC [Clostridia bacterium]|nr:MAG: bifunctional phosphopantothenoylcysteine decarboxylase/phosphopantothenate--cysteine ligase CoaBC [Clostridia bacterium]
MLTGKTILMGITGSVAAYKSAELVSQLVKCGAQVEVVLTRAAQEFVSPLTFASLTGRQTWTEMFAPGPTPIPHIRLAEQAEAVLIAPATAHVVGRLAHGLADDLLTTLVLATRAPVIVAPAMNVQMYRHRAVQDNLERLKALGYHVMAPGSGWLACGAVGEGRLPEPETILAVLEEVLGAGTELSGRKVLITAGGTREPLDPVRYIGNRSSGKMGYAVAEVALEMGAEVVLITAPTALAPPSGAVVIPVETAAEMYQAVLEHFPGVDIVFKAAAVADYRPVKAASQKIKKQGQPLIVELAPTPDILAELGRRKTRQILVGFAAETHDLLDSGQRKLAEKNLDLLVANDVTRPGAGFGSDTNIVTLIFADGSVKELPQLGKKEVARRILAEVVKMVDKE